MMLCTSLAAAPIIPKEVKFLKVVPDGQRQGCSMGPQGGRRELVAFCGRAEASGESKLANSRGVVNNIVNGCRGFGTVARKKSMTHVGNMNLEECCTSTPGTRLEVYIPVSKMKPGPSPRG